MSRIARASLFLASFGPSLLADYPPSFRRVEIDARFHAEGVAIGDVDGDGKADLVAGPFVHLGPDFAKRVEFREAKAFDPKGYSDCFEVFLDDLNEDGRLDVLSVGFPGAETTWYANPGQDARWAAHVAFDHVGNESPAYADVDGDGRRELVFSTGGRLGWAGPDPSDPTRPWAFHAIGAAAEDSPFIHGLGVGDVDGDGRADVLERSGWWEQPDDPLVGWTRHAFDFTAGRGMGGAQMYTFDVDGDGDADVVTSQAAHGWGLSWFEQADGSFRRHEIAGEDPAKSPHGVAFSQIHAVAAFDMDGDGVLDLVTGKRRWAHGPAGDPEPNAPAVLWWFRTVRGKDGVDFDPHLIDDASGVGTQVAAGDLDGDGKGDVAVANKLGTFAFVRRSPAPLWGDGLAAEYHRGTDLAGEALLVRIEPTVDHDWKRGAPATEVGADEFSVRWRGRIRVPRTDDYTFHVTSDDGSRLRVAGRLLLDDWTVHPAAERSSAPIRLEAGRSYPIVLEYFEDHEAAVATLAWSSPSMAPGTVPAEAFCSGLTSAPAGALNLGLESGSLAGWKAEGEAFRDQPIRGDTVSPRRSDMKSAHRGECWIGTYEVAGDPPKGTLVSEPFEVTHPWASCLVAGGAHPETRVEVARADTGAVVFRVSGRNTEDLEPVAIDLTGHVGAKIVIRVVDQHSGGWGHVNFDDFRWHDARPWFPGQERKGPPPPDVVLHHGLEPEAAARAMTLPEGFRAVVFAAEPDVAQPIGMALDDRGRVWVAESYAYPIRQPEGKARDRIVIFEDTDGDGRHDVRKVFTEGLNLVSGLEVGFGGVWVGAAPYLLFIPDADGDDVPDGEPRILLDGWGWQDTHETLNAFTWGPDGWLYGCHGVFTHSRVGKPGTPDAERTPINAGFWRYHPTRHVFEVFAWGTSNSWGIDFDDRGRALATACVIPHLFHVVQGARFERQAGSHFDPYCYDVIPTIADHRHWAGDEGPHGGNGRSDSAGGGHAHAGAMIYLGGRWPGRYRDRIFMNNIHGQRINMDVLEAEGAGLAGRHGPDFLLSNDTSSQILNLRYGPDGDVYFIDWYDDQACHTTDANVPDRSNGRIFKVVYDPAGKPAPAIDLAHASDADLVGLQLHPNDFYVRHARRLLQERAPGPEVHAALEAIALEHADPTRNLRGLWALHATGGLTAERTLRGLAHADPHVRGWTIQLACEDGSPGDDVLGAMARMAREDPSPVVRLYLASALQRLPLERRWAVLEGLVSHPEDAADHDLPYMVWYASMDLPTADRRKALALGTGSKIPLVRKNMLRRIAALGQDGK